MGRLRNSKVFFVASPSSLLNLKPASVPVKQLSTTVMATVKVPTMKLSSGQHMPVLGLGTWEAPPGEVGQAVCHAIDAGYRHIDGAMLYQNEKEVGAAVRQKIKEGVVKREDLFITSKLWCTFHKPEVVVEACKKTLSDLGLDYIDLYLMHWPVSLKPGHGYFPKNDKGSFMLDDVDVVDTYKAMEKCVDLGLTKSIGVSNFNSQQLQRIIDNAKHLPVTNQVECNPYLNQKKLIKYCSDRGVVLTAYGPLGGAPGATHYPPGSKRLLQDPTLATMAGKYKKSVAQLILRYLLQCGTVTIPKSVKKERLQQNIDLFDFEISSEDMALIDTLNCNQRAYPFLPAKADKDYPFNIEF